MKYLNNGNQQYILSFSAEQSGILKMLFTTDDKITVNEDVAIMTNLSDDSLFIQQLKANNIKYYKTTFDNISSIIDNIVENFVLLVLDKDALIVNSLDDTFLTKFYSFNQDYVFGATANAFPLCFDFSITLKYPLIPSFNRFIDSSICFGYKEVISKIFNKMKEIQYHSPEQILEDNRISFYNAFNKDINVEIHGDYQNKLFTDISPDLNYIEEKNGIRYIKERRLTYNNLILI